MLSGSNACINCVFLFEKRNGSAAKKQDLEWSKFGLGEKSVGGSTGVASESSNVKELFHEQDEHGYNSKPWWKSNFFVTEPVLFGTWDGVFTSTMMNIFGVIVFLRTGWMVANAGVGLSFLIICLCVSVALVTALSAVGVCERLHLDAGGVYFLLSHILGETFHFAICITIRVDKCNIRVFVQWVSKPW